MHKIILSICDAVAVWLIVYGLACALWLLLPHAA